MGLRANSRHMVKVANKSTGVGQKIKTRMGRVWTEVHTLAKNVCMLCEWNGMFVLCCAVPCCAMSYVCACVCARKLCVCGLCCMRDVCCVRAVYVRALCVRAVCAVHAVYFVLRVVCCVLCACCACALCAVCACVAYTCACDVHAVRAACVL